MKLSKCFDNTAEILSKTADKTCKVKRRANLETGFSVCVFHDCDSL